MIYIYSFLLTGLICMIGQLILDLTKLTPGHVTSLFVVLGAFLSFIGVYDKLINISLIAFSLPIISFGNLLYKASIEGYYTQGLVGILSNMFSKTSAGISCAIICAFLLSILFKTKN